MITIHCCLTLNMNSHIMASPFIQQQFNFHSPSLESLRQPPGQRGANAEILAPDCIIYVGVGVAE